MHDVNVNVKLMEGNLIQINCAVTINVDLSVKNVMYVKKENNVWNIATRSCENGKCLTSVMDDSAITCNEVIESYEEDADEEAK